MRHLALAVLAVGSVRSQPAGPGCDPNTRLAAGGVEHGGRVEVFHDGQWGTVCDDGFERKDADTVCRSLSMGDATSFWSFGDGDGSGAGSDGMPIFLDEVDCGNGDSSLADCANNGWGNHDCSHGEDVVVECEHEPAFSPHCGTGCDVNIRLSQDGGTDFMGRLEVFHDGQWGTVCDDGFEQNDAELVCSSLGMGVAVHYGPPEAIPPGSEQMPIWLDEVTCQTSASRFDECDHAAWGVHDCSHGEDVNIECEHAPSGTCDLGSTAGAACPVGHTTCDANSCGNGNPLAYCDIDGDCSCDSYCENREGGGDEVLGCAFPQCADGSWSPGCGGSCPEGYYLQDGCEVAGEGWHGGMWCNWIDSQMCDGLCDYSIESSLAGCAFRLECPAGYHLSQDGCNTHDGWQDGQWCNWDGDVSQLCDDTCGDERIENSALGCSFRLGDSPHDPCMECASTSECADDVCACLSGPCWDVCLDQHGNGLAEYVNGGEDSQCCQDNTCAGQEFATFYVQITVEGVTESDIGGEEMNAFKDAFVSSSDGLVDHQDIVDVHVSTIEVNSFGQNDDDRRRLAEAVLLEFVVEKPTDEMGSPDRYAEELGEQISKKVDDGGFVRRVDRAYDGDRMDVDELEASGGTVVHDERADASSATEEDPEKDDAAALAAAVGTLISVVVCCCCCLVCFCLCCKNKDPAIRDPPQHSKQQAPVAAANVNVELVPATAIVQTTTPGGGTKATAQAFI